MTLKKTQQILAYGSYDSFLPDLNIPKTLLEEAQSFIERNTLIDKSPSNKKICCLKCLKAHLLKKCKELNITQVREELDHLIKDEAGHDGYYLDGEEVIAYRIGLKF